MHLNGVHSTPRNGGENQHRDETHTTLPEYPTPQNATTTDPTPIQPTESAVP